MARKLEEDATRKSFRFVRACVRSGCLAELELNVCGLAFSLFPPGRGKLSLFPFGFGSFPFALPPPTSYPTLVRLIGIYSNTNKWVPMSMILRYPSLISQVLFTTGENRSGTKAKTGTASVNLIMTPLLKRHSGQVGNSHPVQRSTGLSFDLIPN